jgi:hypothetical protein
MMRSMRGVQQLHTACQAHPINEGISNSIKLVESLASDYPIDDREPKEVGIIDTGQHGKQPRTEGKLSIYDIQI